jgi:hypothetical protein
MLALVSTGEELAIEQLDADHSEYKLKDEGLMPCTAAELNCTALHNMLSSHLEKEVDEEDIENIFQ